jgi:hypothetical protein
MNIKIILNMENHIFRLTKFLEWQKNKTAKSNNRGLRKVCHYYLTDP